MLQAIISGLILAAVSGLTFLAYKHPKGYGRIYPILLWVSIACCVGIVTYILGYNIGLSDGQAGALHQKTDIFILWPLIGFLVIQGFLFGLFLLPAITKTGRKDDADKDEPPKRKR